MNNLCIKYYPKNNTPPIILDLENDVVEIVVPAIDGRPALKINVNTDTVVVDTESGKRVATYDFREDLYEALLEDRHDESGAANLQDAYHHDMSHSPFFDQFG